MVYLVIVTMGEVGGKRKKARTHTHTQNREVLPGNCGRPLMYPQRSEVCTSSTHPNISLLSHAEKEREREREDEKRENVRERSSQIDGKENSFGSPPPPPPKNRTGKRIKKERKKKGRQTYFIMRLFGLFS